MLSNWQASFRETEVWEGWHKFSDDRYDPGGATYNGITQSVYNAWRISKNLPIQSVRRMTDDECSQIMKAQYWNAVKGDQLPSGLDYLLYDIAVNMGPVTAVKFLQTALKVSVDGHLGIKTLTTAQHAQQTLLLERIAGLRLSRWHALTTWWRFGKGWTSRGKGALQFALQLREKNAGTDSGHSVIDNVPGTGW